MVSVIIVIGIVVIGIARMVRRSSSGGSGGRVRPLLLVLFGRIG